METVRNPEEKPSFAVAADSHQAHLWAETDRTQLFRLTNLLRWLKAGETPALFT